MSIISSKYEFGSDDGYDVEDADADYDKVDVGAVTKITLVVKLIYYDGDDGYDGDDMMVMMVMMVMI